jgi:hypothetical protein
MVDCQNPLMPSSQPIPKREAHNDGLQLRRAISIQAEGTKLLEKHAIAPSAARLCYAAVRLHLKPAFPKLKISFAIHLSNLFQDLFPLNLR